MKTLGIILILTAVLLVGGAGYLLFGSTNTGSQLTPPHVTSNGAAISPYPGTAKANAPVVEVFNDYQCPNCARFQSTYGSALTQAAKAGQIDLRYRTVVSTQSATKASSTKAAMAAACADFVGAYPAYHDLLSLNQPSGTQSYPSELLRTTIPNQIGMSSAAAATFRTCYDREMTRDFVIAADAANAPAQAPRISVNGSPLAVTSSLTPAQLLDAIHKAAR